MQIQKQVGLYCTPLFIDCQFSYNVDVLSSSLLVERICILGSIGLAHANVMILALAVQVTFVQVTIEVIDELGPM